MHTVLHYLRLARERLYCPVEFRDSAHLSSHIFHFALECGDGFIEAAQVARILINFRLNTLEFLTDNFVYFLVKQKTVHLFRIVSTELKKLRKRHIVFLDLL